MKLGRTIRNAVGAIIVLVVVLAVALLASHAAAQLPALR